jgi:dCMP deaminase
MERPTWDQIWSDFSSMISKRSVDQKHKVGVVIVTDDNTQVLSVGYNGDQKGGPNCRESMERGQSGFIHAEINALIKCDYNHPKKKKMYMTLSPCDVCAKAIINAGIQEVIYQEEYEGSNGISILKSADVLVRRHVNE